MQQLPLPVIPPRPAQRRRPGPPAPVPAPLPAAARHLWLCVRFPGLAVEVLHDDPAAPAVAVEILKSRTSVTACNAGAAGHGIAPGMTLSAARSLCAGLTACPRDAQIERRFIKETAGRLLDYSSRVAFYGPDCLAVELKGSLRLFGGLEALLERIDKRLSQLAVTCRTGVAPTVRAAHWLARYRSGTVIETVADLQPALRSLPVAVLCDSPGQQRRLARSGIKTLSDIMRLPRADTARRFGRAFYRPLDQALGVLPEAPDGFRPPPVFEAADEFYLPEDNAQRVAAAAAGLLEKLERFLARRQRAIQQFRCSLFHERRPPTHLYIGMARPAGDAGHLSNLLNERLEQTPPPAPVTHIAIEVTELLEPATVNTDLLGNNAAQGRDWDELLDRIRTRLGDEVMHSPAVRADHRPEYAHRPRTVAEPGTWQTALPERPLWLLNRSVPLSEYGGRLYWRREPLHLLCGVERIEQGWWSADDVRRDYRVALTPDHARMWIYQDLRSRQWYVQGFFG